MWVYSYYYKPHSSENGVDIAQGQFQEIWLNANQWNDKILTLLNFHFLNLQSSEYTFGNSITMNILKS